VTVLNEAALVDSDGAEKRTIENVWSNNVAEVEEAKGTVRRRSETVETRRKKNIDPAGTVEV